MGHTHSMQYGGLVINFEKPYYYPGDLVRGHIYLNMASSFDTKGLELTVKVKEFAQYYETESKTTTETKRVYDDLTKEYKDISIPKTEFVKVAKKDDKTLFKNKAMIATMMNNVLIMGQYSYPFQFTLPHHLPGSFEYYSEDAEAYIKYKINAKALSWHGKKTNIKNSNILIVRQAPTNFSYPTNLSDTRNLSTWCFFSKGTSTLNVSYPKNHFCPDESVQVICNLNNTRCTLNATCIKLQLMQQLTLTIREHGKHSHPHTKYMNRVVAETRYDGNYVRIFILILACRSR